MFAGDARATVERLEGQFDLGGQGGIMASFSVSRRILGGVGMGGESVKGARPMVVERGQGQQCGRTVSHS